MLREELSRLQQPLAHQENTNNIVGASEVHLISDEEATDDQVVLDEVVDSVAGQLSKQASSLLSNDTIACNYQSIVEESTSTTIPVPNFTVVGKSPPRLPSANSTISVDRVELSATICFFTLSYNC